MAAISPLPRYLVTCVLLVYVLLIALSLGKGWFTVLMFLGSPWFVLAMPLLWFVGHNYGDSGFGWLFSICTLPNIVLLIRWIGLRYIKETTEVSD